jgi:hypothetical protein
MVMTTSTESALRWRVLIPVWVVLLCVLIGWGYNDDEGCAPSDGPQFQCYMVDHGH